jgi:DtxR family Mn-dependent transcriptional regulator
MPMSSLPHSQSVEMYVKTVAELGGDQAPVAIARVAERLGVTQVSAAEMMKRLGRDGLIAHTPYRGVSLTAEGRRLAYNVIRRQRLWERFLVDHLNLCWHNAYDLACTLEHATPAEVTEALAAYLGQPGTCPHGNPIPNSAGELEAAAGVLLDSLRPGRRARILALEDESPDVLAYLSQRGLLPGASLAVVEAAPLDGPLTIQLEHGSVALGLGLAARIRVEPLA